MEGPAGVSELIIAKLRMQTGALATAVAARDEPATIVTTGQMGLLIELLEETWPTPNPGTDLQNLKRHVEFPAHYARKHKLDQAAADPGDCLRDLDGLSARLAPVSDQVRVGVRKLVEALPPSPERDLASEALIALAAGASRGAIALVGCALETKTRALYKSVFKKDSGGRSLYSVINQLVIAENRGGIKKEDLPLAHLLRVYRNLADHPSEFKNAKTLAPPLIEIACTLLQP